MRADLIDALLDTLHDNNATSRLHKVHGGAGGGVLELSHKNLLDSQFDALASHDVHAFAARGSVDVAALTAARESAAGCGASPLLHVMHARGSVGGPRPHASATPHLSRFQARTSGGRSAKPTSLDATPLSLLGTASPRGPSEDVPCAAAAEREDALLESPGAPRPPAASRRLPRLHEASSRRWACGCVYIYYICVYMYVCSYV